jgi:hypothetical protein
MTITTPTTEIEALNIILSSIGEAPVSTVAPDSAPDVAMAYAILKEVAKEVQSRGWVFNTETKVEYEPNDQDKIYVPPSVVFFSNNVPNGKIYSRRGGYLFEMTERISTFTDSVLLDQIVLLPFEDIPETGRRYITIRAARIFGDRVLPNQMIHMVTVQDEQDARLTFERQHELVAGDDGTLTIFDNDFSRRVKRGDGPLEQYSGE